MNQPIMTAPKKPTVDERSLWAINLGGFSSYALLVAHDIGLFSLLAKRPLGVAEVATQLNLHERPAEALLTWGLAMGLFQMSDDRYALTPLARDYLVDTSDTYFGSFLDMVIANDRICTFESFKDAVLTNSSQVYERQKLFEAHEEKANLAKAFTHGMHGHSMGAAMIWPEQIDLSGYRQFLDIGGGSGAHAIGVVSQWSNLQATVFDMPPVCEVAQEFAERYALQHRITTQIGDMWTDPYPAADIHFYADIYHDWPPEKGRFLTQKSFDSLKPGGRIILHEMLYTADKTGSIITAMYNLAMLMWTEGQQYRDRDLTTLLQDIGFVDVEVIPTMGSWNLITGRKPSE